MSDVTWCSAQDCPSKECPLKLDKCKTIGIISIADFSGVCRCYEAFALAGMLEDKE